MTTTGLSYQNLRVYEDMVQFIAAAEQHVSTWDRAHAVVDHFYRASEGSLVCLRKSWQASGVHEESPEYADGHPFNHERLEIANRANTKLAVRIEVCALRGGIGKAEAAELKGLLVRIEQMTARLASTWKRG